MTFVYRTGSSSVKKIPLIYLMTLILISGTVTIDCNKL